jgi:thiamine biosynthesis lipoprotein
MVMGTLLEIRVVKGKRSAEEVEHAIDAAFESVRRVDSLMSNYKEDSEVSRINRHAAQEPVTVSPETAEAIGKALELGSESNGAFDITVLPLLEIWGFAKDREKTVPSQEQIDEKLQLVGYELLDLNHAKGTVKLKTEGVGIDLSGIAKGYAADRAIKALSDHGVDSAIINAGGDIYCLGVKNADKGWRVGVTDPTTDNGLLGYVELRDKAIATSGDYRNYFVADGVRYSHILDPRTGRPRPYGPHSVTVIAGSCTEADALATAVFVLGRDEGLKLIERVPEAEGLIVSGSGDGVEIASTSGWKRATLWQRPPPEPEQSEQ